MYLWSIIGFTFTFMGVGLFFLVDFLQKKRLAQQTPITIYAEPEPKEEDKTWYYLDQGQHQIGPLMLRDLEKAWDESVINENSYIWKEGMSQWKKIKELPEIKKDLAKK